MTFRATQRPAPVIPACDRCGQHALEQVLAPAGAFLCPLCFHGLYGKEAERETPMALFTPAPAPVPGQLTL